MEDQVSAAVAQGAEVLCGGRRPNLPGLNGFFYEPTVVTSVNHRMRLMQEETFGPVLPIMVVKDEAEALALANDSAYGLSASVWTRDKKRGNHKLAAHPQPCQEAIEGEIEEILRQMLSPVKIE